MSVFAELLKLISDGDVQRQRQPGAEDGVGYAQGVQRRKQNIPIPRENQTPAGALPAGVFRGKNQRCAKKLYLLTLLLTLGLVYLQVRMEKLCEKAQKNTEKSCTFPALVLYCNL